MPSAYTSLRGSAIWPSITSGDRKPTAVTGSSGWVSSAWLSRCAQPKSERRARPPSSSSTFSGFTSRCTTPQRCTAESASASSAPSRATASGCIGPSAATAARERAARRRAPSRSSSRSRDPAISIGRTIPGCASARTSSVSRRSRSRAKWAVGRREHHELQRDLRARLAIARLVHDRALAAPELARDLVAIRDHGSRTVGRQVPASRTGFGVTCVKLDSRART